MLYGNRLLRLLSGFREEIPESGPLADYFTVAVLEFSDDNHDEINEGPDSQSPKGEDLKYPGAYFSRVKPMCSENAQNPAEYESRQYLFFAHFCLLFG